MRIALNGRIGDGKYHRNFLPNKKRLKSFDLSLRAEEGT